MAKHSRRAEPAAVFAQSHDLCDPKPRILLRIWSFRLGALKIHNVHGASR